MPIGIDPGLCGAAGSGSEGRADAVPRRLHAFVSRPREAFIPLENAG